VKFGADSCAQAYDGFVGADEDFEPRVEKIALPRPRPLTPKERALIDFLLAGPLGRDQLRQQAETAEVDGTCGCGCPSVFLRADPAIPPVEFRAEETPFGRTDHVPIAAVQQKTRGRTEVTLHVVQGRLAELEIWSGAYGMRPRVNLAKLEYMDWSSVRDG
jgi:hypothetical protein